MDQEGFSVQDLSLHQVPAHFRGRSRAYVQLWWIVEGLFFHPSPQFMYAWRRWLLRLFGAKVGNHVLIRPSAHITYPWNVTLADYVWIGDHAVLYSLGEIDIGPHTVVSQRAYICAASHDYSVPSFDIYSAPVVLEQEVWICTDVFVGPGVRVGRGSVVGARSSVFKDLPPMMLCLGNPARPVRPRIS